jgi:hypothetical protein
MSEKALSVHRLVLELFPESKVSLKYKMPTYESENVWFTIGNQKQYLMYNIRSFILQAIAHVLRGNYARFQGPS